MVSYRTRSERAMRIHYGLPAVEVSTGNDLPNLLSSAHGLTSLEFYRAVKVEKWEDLGHDDVVLVTGKIRLEGEAKVTNFFFSLGN